MPQRTIYDIGANDGSDTAFYLAKGFRVVSVEADPALCASLRDRFAPEIADGRVTVVNVGVADTQGEGTFYRNAFSEWSSFLARGKATGTLSHEEIRLPVLPLSEIIAAHGAPYYVKLDIEGYERAAVSTLARDRPLPVFLSVEFNPGWADIADHLSALGFDAFQIVRQGERFLRPPPRPAREGRDVDVTFTNRHSGCFGRDLPDRWVGRRGLDRSVARMLARRAHRESKGRPASWHDIHARRSAALADPE